ncbi:MAG: endonuclease/exonuclease/phosphatase family protein [Myxococcaceae bacterium]
MPPNRIGRGPVPPAPGAAVPRSAPVAPPPVAPPTGGPLDGVDEPRNEAARALGVSEPATVSAAAMGLPLLPIDPSVPCGPDELMVAHYNVENLFDTVDDPVTNDQQFTKAKGYDEPQLEQHLAGLGRVVRAMNGGKGPDVLALTEIENAGVVERLRQGPLADLGYQPVAHLDDGDARGIEPALLTRFPVVGKPVLHPVVNEAGKKYRGILQVDLDVNGRTLTVFLNHWIASRADTMERNIGERTFAAATLKGLIDQTLSKDPGREIVALGDLNESLGGRATTEGLARAATPAEAVKEGRVFDTDDALAAQKAALGAEGEKVQLGTHYYVPGKNWSTFDHLIVAPTLLDAEGLAWVPGSTAVFAPDWLRDPTTGGPRRFFIPKLGEAPAHVDPEGASDHFPIAMRLRKVGEDRRPVQEPG